MIDAKKPEEKKKVEEKAKEVHLSPKVSEYLNEWTTNPKSKIFAKLAEEYRKGGLIEEAQKVCEDGLSANPNYLTGNLVLAKIFYDKGEYDNSFKEAQKVATAQSDNIMAQHLMLDLYIKRGDKSNAIKVCDIISFLEPQNEEIIKKKKALQGASASEMSEAIASLQKPTSQADTGKGALHDKENEEAFATNTIAELYIKQGFYDKALKIYKELLAEAPSNAALIQKVRMLENKMRGGGASAPTFKSESAQMEKGRVAEKNVKAEAVEPKASEPKTMMDKLTGWLGKIQNKDKK